MYNFKSISKWRNICVNTNYKKIILKTAGFTLLALFIASLIMFLLLFFVFTKDLAEFCYYLGNYGMAGDLYSRIYEKDGEINNCYLALTLDIRTDDYKGVIRNYELFVADDEYDAFMNKISYSNQVVSGGVLERSALLNEYNYLEDKYTQALIENKDITKAFDRAVGKFAGYESYTFTSQGYYSLNRFIDADNMSRFNDEYAGYDGKLIDAMQEYFDIACSVFNENKESTDIQSKAYLVALGNRIILVGQNVNTICDALNYNADAIAVNFEKMNEVNDFIKGLI